MVPQAARKPAIAKVAACMIDSETLLKELLETFRLEAQDHIRALSSLLIDLEKESDPAGRKRHVESVFRRMHTLKGAAHAVNLIDVAQCCQELENLLADLKRGDLLLDLGLFDRLHADIDALSELILQQQGSGTRAGVALQTGQESHDWQASKPPSPSFCAQAREETVHAEATERQPAAVSGKEAAAGSEPKPGSTQSGKTPAGETVRVSTRLLESLLLQSEELISAKLAATVLHEELAAVATELAARANDRSRALDLAREALRSAQPDDQAARLAVLVQDNCQVERQTETRLRAVEKAAGKHLWSLRGMVDPLLEDMKKLHLLPFSSLVDPFSKLVRDLARELDKETGFSCSGGEIEIDRRILAELKEPLLHIVRNTMDHGIEKAPERLLQGKPAKGSISIAIRLQDGNHAEVVVTDDGRGIDLAQLKGAALRLELVTPEALQQMSDSEALQLVFESGISTSRIITSLSGRGVGLAIVRESLERLGGHVTVDSRPAHGTEFRLCLPLSFAMMRGLLVQTTGRACILPAANVELTSRVALAEIRRVENRDTVLLGGEVISLVSLARLLELDDRGPDHPDGFQPVVLLNLAEKRIAFAVDQVVGVNEILVKPLGSQLSRVRNVAGATVLGDGRVVPILNIGDLFRSALTGAVSGLSAQAPSNRPRPKRLSVLVAEDSITSRTLLKNILEASGFLVHTAIPDVEMPRMDGFELTAAIRGDAKSAGLPVILVTGLESRSDRERGIDVGANAYIVKSSFDQSSLIEVIQKLT
jgi:two-component system chemotaxis sensor kinase CheA